MSAPSPGEGDRPADALRPWVARILRARVYDVARETPLEPARRLSKRLGQYVFIKREDLQPIFAFKLRGAFNKISALPVAQAQKGLVTASAGNHAQGVALAAQRLGYRATIVMPTTTPRIKVDAVAAFGAEVQLEGDSYDEARRQADRLVERTGAVFVHPFDDPDVIAGQGTVAVEMLRQHPDPIDAIFVPVGGGGLLAGVLAYVKSVRPGTLVFGVEPDDAACMDEALRMGRPVPLAHVGLFADGAAVRQAGEHTFGLARDFVDGILRVSVDDLCAAILDLFEDTRVLAEPAGALAVAGLKQWVAKQAPGDPPRTLIAIQSGANINFHRLRHISERCELGEEREAIFAVTIPERPGSFRALCAALGDRSVTEFNYRYADPQAAHVFVGVQITRGREERRALASELAARGYAVVDLTHDELAVLHARHLVGGRAPELEHERVLRFEFPERPGALRRFLELMDPSWNLTLFHYRNHGSETGRVLAGVQVPPAEDGAFRAYLERLAYPWIEESDNPAYRLFLR